MYNLSASSSDSGFDTVKDGVALMIGAYTGTDFDRVPGFELEMLLVIKSFHGLALGVNFWTC